MKATQILIAVVAIGFMVSPTALFARVWGNDVPEDKQVVVSVNGRTLSGPNSSASRLQGRLLLPIHRIAASLGDRLVVDSATRTISVQRLGGIQVYFNGKRGQVFEGGASILTVSSASEFVFGTTVEGLRLPPEIVSALFAVSVIYDESMKVVEITRGISGARSPAPRDLDRRAEIHSIDYEYGLNRYGTSASHNLNLAAAGRLGDGRFTFASNSSGQSVIGASVRNAAFSLERPNKQRYTVGDVGVSGDLQFLASHLRGASFGTPLSGAQINVFGGKSASGVDLPKIEEPIEFGRIVREASRFDTNTFGASITTSTLGRTVLSAGAARFAGTMRSGTLTTAALNYGSNRFQIQTDIAVGRFAQRGSGGLTNAGSGTALDVSATYQVRGNLGLQGRYSHVGENFMVPRAGARNPINLRAAGVTWSPVGWLTTSVNASSVERPGVEQSRSRSVTAAASINPSPTSPRVLISHTASSSDQIRSAGFTLVSASHEMSSRLRIFVSGTRIKNFGASTVNASMGGSYVLNDAHSLEATQGFGSRRFASGQLDWRTSGFLNQRLSLAVGVGYQRSENARLTAYERVSATLKLPRGTSLQANYYHTDGGQAMLVSLSGSLFRRRDAAAFLDSPASEMNAYGEVTGRVYQDVNGDGKFDANIDKPQAGVNVRVDGNRYIVSDANGMYRFESVAAGEHRIYLDLTSIRADLTILDDFERSTTVAPGRGATYDFSLVRTGRVTGRVWFDANENGKFDTGETPLADVRVVTASGRDTLTDADGVFSIGDLRPGEHVIVLDEKTLPEKSREQSQPTAVYTLAGRQTADVDIAVVAVAATIKRFK